MPLSSTAVALVTGGGRGIGANIARELARAGLRVAVSARTRGQVEAVAQEIGGLAIEADVSQQEDVERDGRARSGARPDRPARRERRASRPSEARAWEVPSRRLVARVRGERARRLPLLPARSIPGMLERGAGGS